MSEQRNVYGFCENNCRFPVYTREEVLTIIQQAINDGTLLNVDPTYAAVQKIVDGNGAENIKFWTGTEAEFNALDPAPSVIRFIPRRGTDGTLYICLDDSNIDMLPTEPLTAEEIAAICV